ncbi:MAG: cytochrome c biogenesis protein CcsA [Kofleriaceae bacterium]|nr:cytochrome c biogenesis protein CcsA [Myxococcales bacterium]MCB9574746.1 cytochrome c biogenesis protein CcsA [Kofleriaceae bacterium]
MAGMSMMLDEAVAAAPAEIARVLSVPPSPAFWAAVLLYGAAATGFLISFLAGKPAAGRAARALFLLAFVCHGVDIGWRGVLRVHPGASVREALGFLAWVAAGGYLATTVRYRADLGGIVAAPLTVAVLAAARLSPPGQAQAGLTSLGRVHIVMAVVGVALFAVATVIAIVYVLEDRSLKGKKFDALTFKRGGAPLDGLDALSHRLVLAGFPIFTVAVVLGMVWVSQRGSTMERPEYPFALVSWGAFGAMLVTRVLYGWRGRRSAWLTLIGFAAAVTVLVIYFLRRSFGG